MYYWVRASPSDFSGSTPQPRSGHSAVAIGKSKIVVFGGLLEKKFLSDIIVYDIEKKLWYQPECTGGGLDGQVGPSPRAFHVGVSIDCHMFIFGGRSGSNRLGDFWVLDTDIWQWSELTSFGDLPSARDFSAAACIGTQKIVLFGGWDGKRWLSDVFLLDTISLEWTELGVSGALPPPRCGHSATMVEKRLLVYGGRGGGGPIMGDLWALKGLFEEENEAPGWTQLKLPGQAPSARCGHTVTSGGHYLLMFGGHGTGGWLSRYDIYYNDCIILDRVSAQWKRLLIGNDAPPARAYHTLTTVGLRHLLIGGFDGKTTFDDIWWLVPQDDPIVKRAVHLSPRTLPTNENTGNNLDDFTSKENSGESRVETLRRKLGISASLSRDDLQIINEFEDKELIELACGPNFEGHSRSKENEISTLRERWRNSEPSLIRLKELSPLLRDYQRLIALHHLKTLSLADYSANLKDGYQFYHLRNASQLRMEDVPKLLSAYKAIR